MEQVDERQLAELFRAAADGGPPARFGHGDVVTASRRATMRRRAGIAGATTLGVAVLLGAVLTGNALFGGPRGSDMSAASPEQPLSESDRQGRADAQPQQQPGELGVPASPSGGPGVPASPSPGLSVPAPSQGTGKSGKVVPWPGLGDGDARAGCGPADRELAEALAARLPAVDPALAVAVPDSCPPQARAVAVPVADADAAGWIYLVLAPVRGDGPPDRPLKRADGAVGYQWLAPSGRVLVVLSVPRVDGGRPPFASDIPRIAEELGSRY
jgi:hypothetical protein